MTNLIYNVFSFLYLGMVEILNKILPEPLAILIVAGVSAMIVITGGCFILYMGVMILRFIFGALNIVLGTNKVKLSDEELKEIYGEKDKKAEAKREYLTGGAHRKEQSVYSNNDKIEDINKDFASEKQIINNVKIQVPKFGNRSLFS